MGLLLTLLLGGIAGWLASLVTNRDAEQGLLMNIVVGIIGAILANWVLAPIFGIRAELDFSLAGFLMSVAGAVVLLIIVNLFTRKKIR